jgi:hypothetical protein
MGAARRGGASHIFRSALLSDGDEIFVDDLRRGAFTYLSPSAWHISRAMDIDRRYADLGLGLVDASIIAVAEEVGVSRLATRDIRHFAAVRLRGGQAFDLVVHPSPINMAGAGSRASTRASARSARGSAAAGPLRRG